MAKEINKPKEKEQKVKEEKVEQVSKENIKVKENAVQKEEKSGNKKEQEESKTEIKPEKQEEKPVVEKEKQKEEKKVKEKAIVNGKSLRISPKHSYAICKMIKRKKIDTAIEMLEEVIKKKRAVPMPNREVAHQKGMSGGAFPKNACIEIILLLKQLKANASVAEIENPVIVLAKANKASRPYRREGRRGKRTHVYIEVKSLQKGAKSNRHKKINGKNK